MKDSGIQWTDHTFNPWIGCTKKSPGCLNCYAEGSTFARVKRSQGHETWGKGAQRVRTSEANWKQPLTWNRAAQRTGTRPRVFCASLADWLDDEVPIEWLGDLLSLIYDTPHLDWLLLTKRPENFYRLEEAKVWSNYQSSVAAWIDGSAPANVWIGTTVEDQARAIERIPLILDIPAKVRFLSCEPLLEPLDLGRMRVNDDPMFFYWPLQGAWIAEGMNEPSEQPDNQRIHWVIAGGESGPDSRPCHAAWIANLVQQCVDAGVPCFVKQLGAHIPDLPLHPIKHKKGGEISEWPASLQVRQFPTIERS